MKGMVREGRGPMPATAHSEGLRVAEILARRIQEAGYSYRAVEELCGWSVGSLTNILSGEQPIRFSHAAAVCDAIGYSRGEFYRELAGDPGSGRGGGEPDPESGAGASARQSRGR